MPDYRFSTDPLEMDRELVLRWLSEESYWAKGRPESVQDAAMDGSINAGIFDAVTGAQLAYARIITDSATFAWLCDVFVDTTARGAGVGVALMEGITALLEPMKLKRVMLVTADAHGLYEKFGFAAPEKPDWVMAKVVER
jgi:GNAT superfamily N-acetyltransferase